MTGQRIRYNENETGILVSNEFLLNGDVVRVELNKSIGIFAVVDSNGTTRASGKSRNFTVLRSIARKALKTLGVSLVDEVRKVV